MVRFSWSICGKKKKTATLLGVSRGNVSKVMSEHTNRGKTISAERNSGLKSTVAERDRQSYTEKDCFEKSWNYCSTDDGRTEQKLQDVSFTTPHSTAGSSAAV
jgi:hypothetical protein